jgi:hypothetical protein
MSFVFHPVAEQEFNEAIDYYQGIDPALGYDFATEVYSAIQRAVSLPEAWTAIDDEPSPSSKLLETSQIMRVLANDSSLTFSLTLQLVSDKPVIHQQAQR